jgi:phosphate transport system permease protein
MDERKLAERTAGKLMLLAAVFSSIVILALLFVLVRESLPILQTKPLGDLLFSSAWQPWQGEFGFYPFIMGTLWVTALAMALAVPLSLFTSIYLAEYAPAWLRGILKPVIDLLAGIPSVIYGLWGVLFIVPLIRDLAPMLGLATTGYTVLAGGIVLAIMVFPIIISLSEEVIRSVPRELREASLALGATKWETLKKVVLRSAFPGVISAVLLGFGRAFGETMAVLMVVGNVPTAPSSLLDPGYPLPALIANNYGEMMSVPLYGSALMLAALLLLIITVLFGFLAGKVSKAIRRRYGDA